MVTGGGGNSWRIIGELNFMILSMNAQRLILQHVDPVLSSVMREQLGLVRRQSLALLVLRLHEENWTETKFIYQFFAVILLSRIKYILLRIICYTLTFTFWTENELGYITRTKYL